jgi:hypothetical protein
MKCANVLGAEIDETIDGQADGPVGSVESTHRWVVRYLIVENEEINNGLIHASRSLTTRISAHLLRNVERFRVAVIPLTAEDLAQNGVVGLLYSLQK